MLRYIFILLLLAISAQADSLLVAAGVVGGAILGYLYSDRQPSNRPFLVVYYSAGSEPEPTTKTVKKVHLRKVKL